ncbi:MAG: aspartate--tRNA ligase [Holosporales bacterium]|jgi:aspartyl-tRNA synthetase|nr:aspartate--tRNA ligase [Holosporales bacterium]
MILTRQFKAETYYRTHTCDALRIGDIEKNVKLSGFVHRIRDHGGLLFVDLRDHYGITQCVLEETEGELFDNVSKLFDETVVSISGVVVKRPEGTNNSSMNTGDIEVSIKGLEILSAPHSNVLPIQVNVENEFPEETRLTYRYLDLRRIEMHNNIVLRSEIIAFIRNEMRDMGFTELQTPILTSSSPEGARDYLVPSRVHHGKFYALPQAPQQFKQLFMVSGFDRYFQIAPCFRDEDSRADRSPGEFYQLDFEMSFATQDDVFPVVERVLHNTFERFAKPGYKVTDAPFPRIPYSESMLHYGCDKPDLRNPLIIEDLTDLFAKSGFQAFAGNTVRSINVPCASSRPRSFFDRLNDWAKDIGLPGIGYISMESENEFKGPIAKFMTEDELREIARINNMKVGDVVFFVCNNDGGKTAGIARQKLGTEMDIIEKDAFRFCWIIDFPMYELDEETGNIIFSHNPFSMPQGGLEALNSMDPLEIKAFQYDIVCNGIELSSGAIRNHIPDIMYRAFEIAGYARGTVDNNFRAMINAFKCGSPPHGGCAPGIDRIVMMLAGTDNIREVIAFPFNQKAEDILMGAPAEVSQKQLDELHIAVLPKIKK